MKRFDIALVWAGFAFISSGLAVILWIIYHKELINIAINSAVSIFCIIAWIIFVRNAKKDINE